MQKSMGGKRDERFRGGLFQADVAFNLQQQKFNRDSPGQDHWRCSNVVRRKWGPGNRFDPWELALDCRVG